MSLLPRCAVLALLPAVLATGLVAQQLELRVGIYPGSTEARIDGAPPGSLVTLLLGHAEGNSPLPGGQVLGIEAPLVAGTTTADARGSALVIARFPRGSGAGATFFAQAMALDPHRSLGDPDALHLSPVQSLQVPTPDDVVDVCVLFGQSNAEGYASVSPLPDRLLGRQSQARIWNLLTGAWEPLEATVNNATFNFPGKAGQQCGPELTLADSLCAPGRPIYLVKQAVGGTALAPTPGSAPNEWNVQAGELYRLMTEQIRIACDGLRRDGLVPRVRAICMMQGESDADDPAKAAVYRDLLRRLVEQLRADLEQLGVGGSGPVPFVIGLIHPRLPAGSVKTVRAAQVEVARELPRCDTVETLGFSLQSDGVHFDTSGVMDLGRALAERARKLELGS